MFTIQFDYPEGSTVYAGKYKGAAGWAPTLATAWLWEERESAERWLKNGYGKSAEYGKVIEVPDAGL